MMRLHGFVQRWFLYAKPPRHTRPQMLIEMGRFGQPYSCSDAGRPR